MSASAPTGLQRRRVNGNGGTAAGIALEDDVRTASRSLLDAGGNRPGSFDGLGGRNSSSSSGGYFGSDAGAGPSTPKRSRDGRGGTPLDSPSVATFNRSAGDGQAVTMTDDRGKKVAYDPRDLTDEDEVQENPRLTLMEEVLLLGLKDRAGYLSFWNDNISYALRGCILLELALRGRIAVTKDPSRRRFAVQDRIIEVVSTKMTGEILLDEALKVMKACEEPMSCSQWVDLLSGETWNWMKIGYQMKQVRERLAKGLVDKGVLRTEKRNFLLFDMATHPVADTATKDAVIKRILVLLTSQSPTVHPGIFYREEKKQIVLRMTRTLCLLCCAFAANVLENTLTHLSYEAREAAFQKADDILNEFSQWPMAPKTPGGGVGASLSGSNMGSTTKGTGIGEGSVLTDDPTEANLGVGVTELARTIKSEFAQSAEGQFEAIAAVLSVLSTMDSLL